MTYLDKSRRLSYLLVRACDLFHNGKPLPGHGAEYEAIMAEIATLEAELA